MIVVGDFNARIGKEDGKFTFHDRTNRNGEKLIELAQSTNLVISNTKFQKRKGKLWTYLSPSGEKYQLDYILIRNKWKNSINNVEAYSTFSNVGSDHRIVSARIKLSLRANRTTAIRKPRYDWKSLRENPDLQQKYTIAVRNRFNVLSPEIDETATERYERFIKANEEAAKECLAEIQPVRKKRNCNDKRVKAARQNVEKAYDKFSNSITDSNRKSLREAESSLSSNYRTVAEEDLSNKIDQIDKAQNEHSYNQSWKLINEISGRRAGKKGQIEGNTQEERVNSWYKHFSNLLGNPPVIKGNENDVTTIFDEQNIEDGPFTMTEFQKAKKSLIEGKASAEDSITPEIIKRCGLDEEILEFCNQT